MDQLKTVPTVDESNTATSHFIFGIEMQEDTIHTEWKLAQKFLLEIRDQLMHIESDRDTIDLEKSAKGNINKLVNCEQALRNLLLEIPISQRSTWRRYFPSYST